ncbi:MAG: hypothetical protein HYX88_02095 [Chloroflexi bacterium]|nr:hypothetical protein [Chloroflexota bacterium]
MPFETGPYIQVAAFCENVIEDKNGLLSLIRLIDTLTHTTTGPEPPSQMPPVTWNMKLVIALKSGEARGRHEVRVVPQLPSGETKPPLVMSAYFRGEEQSQNLIAEMTFTFEIEGLYWFVTYLDDEFFTRIPFHIKYLPIPTGPAG